MASKTAPKKKMTKKVITVQKAPKKVQAANYEKPRISANDDYFNAVIDPFHCQGNWHLPDDFAGNTSLFKQTSTIGIPLTDANADDEVVVLVNNRPDVGTWVYSPVAINDNSGEAVRIYPDEHLKRLRFLQSPITSMSQLEDMNHVRNMVKERVRLKDGTLLPKSMLVGTTMYARVSPALQDGNWAQSYWNSASSNDAQQYSNLNPAVGTASYYPRWNNDQEQIIIKDELGNLLPSENVTTPAGVKTVALDCNITNGNLYPINLSCHYQGQATTTANMTINLRRVDNDAVVATSGSFSYPTTNSSKSITASASFVGQTYLEFLVVIGNAAAVGITINLFNISLPLDSSGRQVYRVPTPDAGTIMEKTQGVRVTAQDLLTTYMGSTLNDQGQIVCAKLPSDYFNSHSLADITYDSICNLPQHYDGRLSDGGHSILPPYGVQQSVFLSEVDDPLSEEALAVPRIVHVIKGGVQPLRLRVTTCLEGPSTSQLFRNRPRCSDPAQLARVGMACANMPTDSANAIHLMIASLALTAWKGACAAWPYIESAAHWASAFCGFIKKGVASQQSVEKTNKKVTASKVRQ
jgi:hypothetical protein